MVTMKELAECLGLSRATISHVLNGRADRLRIKPETQKKILAAAKKMGYRRNEVVRTMVTGQTRIVCMLVKNLAQEYFSMSAEGVLNEANKAGMFLKMATWASTTDFEAGLRRAMEIQPMGLICRGLVGKEIEILEREMSLNPLPVVLMDNHPGSDAWAAKVCSDDLMGFRLILSRLLELGHRSVGYLSSLLDSACFSRSRLELFIKAAEELGVESLECDRWFVALEELDEFAGGFAAELNRRPRAVVAPSDGYAYRFVKGIEKRGIVVPKDLSVTGYGNTHVAVYGTPSLCTVGEPYVEVGETAFRTLLEMIGRNGNHPRPGSFNKLLPVKLIPGSTVAQPRSARRQSK